ncbi:MAG: hypothetical protein PHT03_08970 [Bacilli bacterium]|nr:hypothetical protein [Bacilli bacterium]
MNKISVIYNYNQYDIIIDKFKVFAGENIKTKIKIIRTLRSYFQTSKLSDYGAANNFKRIINWNDHYLDKRRFSLYELNQYYELNKDLKLGSQSLMLKYYESIFENIEYLDEINTINTLLENFNYEYIDEFGQFGELKIVNLLNTISSKLLLKLMGLNIQKDDLDANEFDLDYDEIIILQLNLLKEISLKQDKKDFIVLMDIPILTEKIQDKLNINSNNLSILIFPLFIENPIKLNSNDVALCNETFIDLCDEEQLYDLTLNLPYNLSIEELKYQLFLKLDKFIPDKTDFVSYLE